MFKRIEVDQLKSEIKDIIAEKLNSSPLPTHSQTSEDKRKIIGQVEKQELGNNKKNEASSNVLSNEK